MKSQEPKSLLDPLFFSYYYFLLPLLMASQREEEDGATYGQTAALTMIYMARCHHCVGCAPPFTCSSHRLVLILSTFFRTKHARTRTGILFVVSSSFSSFFLLFIICDYYCALLPSSPSLDWLAPAVIDYFPGVRKGAAFLLFFKRITQKRKGGERKEQYYIVVFLYFFCCQLVASLSELMNRSLSDYDRAVARERW